MKTTSEGTPRLIYVCASGHSGSTLLDLILGSHSQVTSLGEVGQFTRFFRDNEICTCGVPVRRCEFWQSVRDALLAGHSWDLFDPPADHVASFMTGHNKLQNAPGVLGSGYHLYLHALAVLGTHGLFRLSSRLFPSLRRGLCYNWALFAAVAHVTGRPYVVDSSKTPLRMKLLYLHHPDRTKVLYLTRDGRGVVTSQVRKRQGSVMKASRGWLRTQLHIRSTLRRMPRRAWKWVRYEDLCDAPRDELGKICDWLEIPTEPAMLRFREMTHHNLAGNRMRFGEREEIVKSERWRSFLSEEDRAIFMRIAGSMNRRLGYRE